MEGTGREKERDVPEVLLPEGFICRMKKLLGEEYPLFWASYQSPRVQGLRLNGLKGKREELKETCGSCFNLEPVAWAEDGFYYGREDRPGRHPYHEAGLYYIQEPSAMAAAAALEVKPGDRVLDLCAAPGGKSTQIASYLQGQGLLISNEIHPARAKILSQNIERMGAANVVVTNHDTGTLARWLPEFFDKIVVDAPCSGEGMFRKEPEARAQWTPDSPGLCSVRQQEILHDAACMLKPGGRLVYSTCTFAPEENEGTVEAFLQKHREFLLEASVRQKKGFSDFSQGRPEWLPGGGCRELEDTCRLWPHKIRGEGHYLAVLCKSEEAGSGGIASEYAGETGGKRKKRTGEGKAGKEGAGQAGKTDREWERMLEQFCQEVFCTENGTGRNRPWEGTKGNISGRYMLFGEQLYYVPGETPDIQGKKVLRPGLHLGSFKKKRFEPSHALALYLKKEQVKQWVNLDSEGEWVIRYLKGEILPAEEASGGRASSGWILITADGYSLGWGKLAGGRLQNHYPKGLRRLS